MSLLTLIVMTAAVAAAAGELEVVILHTNDVHSRFDQADVGGSSCSEREAAAGQCWGGYARLATKVKEIRATYSNVLLLDAGDQFQGTVWYTVHKWRVVDHFMNLLQYDVMALGNHEFDDDIEGVVPFLHNNSFAVVSSNIDARHEPSMQGLFTSSTILSLTGNQKVGIVGYTTRDTPILAATGNLIFQDVIESVQNEARRLIAEEGVNKIIALGHGGLALDIEMAEKVEEIDVIVGGHTHTFLWTGTPPSVEIPAGPYPTIVKNSATNRDIPIVQAYTNGKYLGVLKVTFDDDGNVLVADGEPIPLDSSVHQDEEMIEALKPWKEEVVEAGKDPVGTTLVYLEGRRDVCRLYECNLGNLAADAAVEATLHYTNSSKWNDVAIALWNGGGIRASIDELEEEGLMRLEDLLTAFPFANYFMMTDIKGSTLMKVLEHSVGMYSLTEMPGRFLQVSGLRVVYDLRKPSGSRVIDVQATCTECRIPKFEPLDTSKVYRVVLPTYVYNGGDGYSMFKDEALSSIDIGVIDIDIIKNYMTKHQPISNGLDGRLTFSTDDPCANSSAPPLTTSLLLAICALASAL